jgi:L-rhamnose isomerase
MQNPGALIDYCLTPCVERSDDRWLAASEQVTHTKQTEIIAETLDGFHVELPSWGFANTGTRFGKFLQPAAATSI